jgi:GalNAc-alpha-(1->4)-GalNAc-alpha-(1->3)-diNAcBac-PP-undecaprenol alpha-1,4-N-acetyl-D-galactosaminyltransferase
LGIHVARASVFVLASEYEGTSNALMEAMSMGLVPVISNLSGGNLALVEDGKNGLVAPVNDPATLANILRQLIESSDLRQRLGRAAAMRVSGYTPSNVAAEWEKILDLRPLSTAPDRQ